MREHDEHDSPLRNRRDRVFWPLCMLLGVSLALLSGRAAAQDEMPPDERPTEGPGGGTEMPPPPPGTSPAPPSAGAQAGPPAPGKPAPALTLVKIARYSRYRSHWYLGLGLGFGGGWLTAYDNEFGGEGGMTLLFKVGWIARPWLLVGMELSMWIAPDYQNVDTSDTTVTFVHFDPIMVTFYPLYDQGLYVKSGLGVGSTTLAGDFFDTQSESGFDFKLGAGWELQLLEAFNVGAELSWGLTTTESFTTHDLGVYATLSWY